MSVSHVGGEDPYERPPLQSSDLILQSPDVSVAIMIRSTNRSNLARISVERTCYYDSQVPWRPYWRALTRFLQTAGHRIQRH